jgi:leucyl aminopeptidase
VWALDSSLPIALEEQVRALAEGAVIGGYDGRRWRSGESSRAVERFVICGCPDGLTSAANRAALVARWTNTARELVDSPANLMSPADLSDRVVKFAHLDSEIVDPVRAGLGALVAVGECSPIPSRHLSSAIGREARPVTGSARWSSWPRG